MEKLFKHQERFLAKNPNKILLCWDTGTGKTRGAIEWIKIRGAVEGILIICPKALKENWKRSLTLWGLNTNLNYIQILTKEEFRRDAEKLEKYEVVVIDEAHYFSGQKSQMSKNLRKYLRKHKVENVLLLTATPFLSTPWNIYTLASILGYEWNWFSFKDKFFIDRHIGRRVVPAIRPGMEEEIAALVRKIGDVVDIEECADIPEQSYETEYFELTPAQEKAKKDFLEPNPAVRYTAYHQIENGTLKGNEYEPAKEWPTHKEERIKELIEEHKKIVIVARYNLQVHKIERMALEMGKKVYVITGEVKDRDPIVLEAEAASEAVVVVNAACSEGYQLPSFPVMVFASLSFSFKDKKQMVGRILRIDKLKKNVYIFLVNKGVDEAVYQAIMNKQNFDVEIYEREGLSNKIQSMA